MVKLKVLNCVYCREPKTLHNPKHPYAQFLKYQADTCIEIVMDKFSKSKLSKLQVEEYRKQVKEDIYREVPTLHKFEPVVLLKDVKPFLCFKTECGLRKARGGF